jgi:DNA modification methylase
MQIEMRLLSSISPYANNPRENDSAVDAVAQSLQEFGWRQPIVVDEAGVIIVGHTRYKAALKLGLKEVPVHVAVGLSPEKVQAYRIADNKSGDLSDWNYDLLAVELGELQEKQYDLESLGFSPEELNRWLQGGATEGLTDPDEIPAPPDAAITQPGDLWILGNHRLLCGDSSLDTDVNRLLDGACIHLVNCDPPYGVKVEPRSNNAIAAGNSSFEAPKKRSHHQSFDVARQGEKQATHKKLRAKDRPLANDFVSDEEFDRLLDAWFGQIARVLEPGRSFYIWGGYANLGNYPGPLKRHGLYFSQAIVWDKQHPVLTRKDMMGAFELAFYGWKEGKAHQFFGPHNATDLWAIKKVNPQSMVHLTEKPFALAVRAMEYSSQPGENVLDLFGGSGSTLIAAAQTGRKAFLMEIDGLYCDVIVQRFIQFTGLEVQCLDSQGNATDRGEMLKRRMAA